jgi:hypothetical protein
LQIPTELFLGKNLCAQIDALMKSLGRKMKRVQSEQGKWGHGLAQKTKLIFPLFHLGSLRALRNYFKRIANTNFSPKTENSIPDAHRPMIKTKAEPRAVSHPRKTVQT